MNRPQPEDISNYRIQHGDVEWSEADGRVQLRKQKFGRAGSWILRRFKINPILTIKLDAMGTAAWHLMDGRTVGNLLDELESEFADEGRLTERFTAYLSRLVANGLVDLQEPLP